MILALAGGVGGAKLSRGLAAVLEPEELTVIVNTGDDFEHIGLTICPDLDTVMYTMAGINNRAQGWGLAGDSDAFMDALAALGGDSWFKLGDRDLATHVLRTWMLRGATLSEVTAHMTGKLGLRHKIAPMSDDRVRSIIETDEGSLAFQDYFVRRRAEPVFRSIHFDGVDQARPSSSFINALDNPRLEAIVICPSNPILSIRPILALPGIVERLRRRRVPLVAVSPFIAGQSVKGPAAKIFGELGHATNADGVIAAYEGLLDGLVVDHADRDITQPQGLELMATGTLMRDDADQMRLAGETIAFARRLSPQSTG